MGFYRYNSRDREKKILTEGVDVYQLRKLIVDRPKMFKFDSIPSCRRSQLLMDDPDFYAQHISFDGLTQGDQVDIALSRPGKFAHKINWAEMNTAQRNKIAGNRPSWFLKYKIPLDKLSGDSWLSLIKYKSSLYLPLFLDHVTTFTNKTEVRKVFHRKQYLINYLTVEMVEQSVLSAKEWMLLAGCRQFTRLKTPPTFNSVVLEWLESELALDVLSGKAKNTKPLKRARAKAGV